MSLWFSCPHSKRNMFSFLKSPLSCRLSHQWSHQSFVLVKLGTNSTRFRFRSRGAFDRLRLTAAGASWYLQYSCKDQGNMSENVWKKCWLLLSLQQVWLFLFDLKICSFSDHPKISGISDGSQWTNGIWTRWSFPSWRANLQTGQKSWLPNPVLELMIIFTLAHGGFNLWFDRLPP